MSGILSGGSRFVVAAGVLAAMWGVGRGVTAAVVTNNPNLPPNVGVYDVCNPCQIQYTTSALSAVVRSPYLAPNAAMATRTNFGMDERQDFPATLFGSGEVTVGANPPLGPFAVDASGPAQSVAHFKAGMTTGTFNTELLSLNLSGVSPLGPYMIRESPTLPSLGQTMIDDIGGGQFRITSFFDIFTELSIDGGQSWIPDSSGPTHLTLIPEPATAGLAGLGALTIAAWRLCRKRRGD